MRYKDINNKIKQIVYKHKLVARYIMTGLLAGTIDLVALFVFKEYFKLWYLTSAIFAFLISFTLAFIAQKYWTFGDYSNDNIHGQFFWYFFTVTSSLCLSLIILSLQVEFLHIYYLWAQMVSLSVAGVFGFVMNIRNVFSRAPNVNGIVIAAAIFPPDIGGPASHIHRLAEELSSRRVKVSVITYSKTRAAVPGDSFDVIRIPVGLPTLLRGVVYLVSLFISAASYQNIFAQDITSTGLLAVIVKKILPHKRLIIRIGGDLLWERETENGGTNLSTIDYYKMGAYKKEFIYRVGKFVMSSADQIIVPAEFLKDIYVNYYKISASKILVLRNPIPFSVYDPGHLREIGPVEHISADRVVLFAGRFIKFKNVPMLIRTFFSVYDKIKPAKLVLIGNGPEKQKYIEIISGHPLMDKVEVINTLSQGDLFSKIKESTICVCPSWTEPNSNFSLECMSYGKPVLMTKNNGLSVKLPEEMLFSYNDQNEFERKLEVLLNGDFDRDALAQLVNIETGNNSWNNILARYLKIFSLQGEN